MHDSWTDLLAHIHIHIHIEIENDCQAVLSTAVSLLTTMMFTFVVLLRASLQVPISINTGTNHGSYCRSALPAVKREKHCFSIYYKYIAETAESFLPVTVTTPIFQHSCGPDPSKQQMAMVRGGKMQPSLTDVEDIAKLLRAGALDNASLRTLLQERLPCPHIPMDRQFLRNFKNRRGTKPVHTLTLTGASKTSVTRIDELPSDESTGADHPKKHGELLHEEQHDKISFRDSSVGLGCVG
jgi:hypothetical protein